MKQFVFVFLFPFLCVLAACGETRVEIIAGEADSGPCNYEVDAGSRDSGPSETGCVPGDTWRELCAPECGVDNSYLVCLTSRVWQCVVVDHLRCSVPPSPDAGVDTSHVDEIRRGYPAAVAAYAVDHGLPEEWTRWMLDRASLFDKAYIRARTDRRIRVEVRYANAIPYDPPWTDENEHLAALERDAELTYIGWDFSFSFHDPDAEFFVVLGHRTSLMYGDGVSYADIDSNTVYLVWETIFTHEFAHLLGVEHHYCGDDLTGPCAERPPGEGPCLMNRDVSTWGPTEQFVLNLGQQRNDAAIEVTAWDMLGRYPTPWPPL